MSAVSASALTVMALDREMRAISTFVKILRGMKLSRLETERAIVDACLRRIISPATAELLLDELGLQRSG